MIKNESNIIRRCLSRALPHVHAISVLDTGSTDDTVELCEELLADCGKPSQIHVEPFRNFGQSRCAKRFASPLPMFTLCETQNRLL